METSGRRGGGGGGVVAVGLLLLSVWVGGGDAQVSCPPVGGNETVLLPDPTDCTKYYVCDNGSPIQMNCPPPLVFDPSMARCESPAVYQCTASTPGGSTTTTVPTTTTTTTARPITTTARPNVTTTTGAPTTARPGVTCRNETGIELVANPDDCKSYFICVDGVLRPERFECPNDFLFDPVLNECNVPEDVNCGGNVTTTTTAPPNTTRLPITTTLRPNTTTTYTTTTSRPSTTTTTPGEPGFPVCDPQVISSHPFLGNCSLYIVCVHGSMTLYKCPGGMAFDSVARECRPEAEALCANSASPWAPVLLRETLPREEDAAAAAAAPQGMREVRRSQRLRQQVERRGGASGRRSL